MKTTIAVEESATRASAVPRPVLVYIVALGMLVAPSLRADTLFSTLGQASFNYSDATSSPGWEYASGFLTGGSATTITGATLLLANDDSITHTFTVSLFADSGSGSPGSLVGSFDTFALPAYSLYLSNYSTASVGIPLLPNTVYWAVLKVNEPFIPIHFVYYPAIWPAMAGVVPDPGSVFSSTIGTERSVDSGTTWYYADGSSIFSLTGFVPEPSAFALLSVGLAVPLLRRRKR